MLQNNLDPEVAESPEELVVYGGIGKAARNWECFDAILAALRELEDDETLLVQSGKPVGVFRTHADAPRVLIANSNLVPKWATWEHFNELDRKGLMMYGQMTAGSWIYIGSQGIVQGTYETFAEAGRQHFGGDLARPLDPDRRPGRHGRRAAAGRDHGRRRRRSPSNASRAHRLPPAHRLPRRAGRGPRRGAGTLLDAHAARKARSRSACSATPPRSLPELVRCAQAGSPARRSSPTRPRAHDPVNGYLPRGWTRRAMAAAAQARPGAARDSSAPRVDAPRTCGRCSTSRRWACRRVDYGNNIRQVAKDDGVENAFDFPGFVPAYIRPLFCGGKGPFRWVGAVRRSAKTSAGPTPRCKELFPRRQALCTAGSTWRAKRIALPGPAGAHLLARPRRAPPRRPGVQRDGAHGELKAPIVIGRDHLDTGSVASPEPRDRRHARRHRRRVRLAAAERAAEHRERRDLGLAPPRRRRRHGLLAARRRGHRLRRHATPRRSASSACCGTTRRPA